MFNSFLYVYPMVFFWDIASRIWWKIYGWDHGEFCCHHFTTMTLWLCQNSYWTWPLEIVDLPIDSMVIFHSYGDVYQRVGFKVHKWNLTKKKNRDLAWFNQRTSGIKKGFYCARWVTNSDSGIWPTWDIKHYSSVYRRCRSPGFYNVVNNTLR